LLAEKEPTSPSLKVTPVDTTAAGDTFTGFFLANFADGKDARSCLEIAAKASALCITRPGASDSIPSKEEVEKFNKC